jgi:polyhydroxyalkanoate synthesis regulator phasin
MSRSTSKVKRNTAIGLTAGLLGGGAIGLMLGVPALTSAAGPSPSAVIAQDDTPTDDTTVTDDTDVTTTDDITTDDITTDDITTDDTTTDEADSRLEPGVRLREQLQELVDNGTLTSEQADTVATFLVENRPEHDGHGGFPGGPGGPGGFGRGHGGFGIESGEIADLFGLEPGALRDLLRDGQSLADVATAQGVDVQTVIDTLVNASKEHLDEAVADGRITQEEADAKLVEQTERITEMVNTARPAAD